MNGDAISSSRLSCVRPVQDLKQQTVASHTEATKNKPNVARPEEKVRGEASNSTSEVNRIDSKRGPAAGGCPGVAPSILFHFIGEGVCLVSNLFFWCFMSAPQFFAAVDDAADGPMVDAGDS